MLCLCYWAQCQLNKRISAHRYQINNNGNQPLYWNFNHPGHSILHVRVVILEKLYRHTNTPTLSNHYRRQREEFWIKTLGIALVYMEAMIPLLV